MQNSSVVSFSSFKGGVGKTTLSILTTLILVMARLRVLVIDLDHQANSSRWHYRLGRIPSDHTLASAIKFMDARSSILPSHIHDCDVLPVGFEILEHYQAPLDTLQLLIDPLKDDYDVVLLDCPPTLNNLVVGAWTASDRIVTPARLDSFDQYGIQFLEAAIRANTEFDLEDWSIVINFFKKPRTSDQMSLDLQYEDNFTHNFPHLSPVRIPNSATARKVVHDNRSLTRTKRTSELFDGLTRLASWITGSGITVDEEGL
jgi:chromosome partitioning protein